MRLLTWPWSLLDPRWCFLVCGELDPILTAARRSRHFVSPVARAKLVRDVPPGNATLVQDFGMTPFPTLTEQSTSDWKSYPGLSPERARDLRERHNKIKRSAGYQLERATLLLRRVTRRFRAMFASTDCARAWRGSRREAPQASKPS